MEYAEHSVHIHMKTQQNPPLIKSFGILKPEIFHTQYGAHFLTENQIN